MPAPWILIGNPANRRVTGFQDALARHGLPPARTVAWIDVIRRGAEAALAGLDPAEAIVRIDAAGEDDAVERALIARGHAAALAEGAPCLANVDTIPVERGRILAPRQHHLGFTEVLAELAIAFAARPAWRVLQPPHAIAELFDKRATWRRYRALGIPVPEALDPSDQDVRDPDALRAAMDARGWRSVFVKLAHGSSAAGLAVLMRASDGDHAMTTVEQVGGARYNTRRIRRVSRRDELDRLLAFLLAEGAQVERAVAKARLGGRQFDCRVLVVAGAPAFTVVRTATHPITNLHLGGARGDVAALRAACPAGALEAAHASCQRIQAAHGTFHLGVDVLFEPGLRAHRVLEANAFGDLLPRLERDGLDVYGWQIRAALGSA